MPNVKTNPQLMGQMTEDVSTARDLQRAALRDLVCLSNECAATESQIERERRTALDRAEAELRNARQEIEARYGAEKQATERKHEEFLAQIAATHRSDLERLEAAQEARRLEMDQEHASAEQEVKKKYAQAAWLAETVLEGTQGQLREEAAKAREGLIERRQLMAQAEQQAAGVMFSLGHGWAVGQWPEKAEEEDEEPVPGLEDIGEDVTDKSELPPARPAVPIVLGEDAAEPPKPKAPFVSLYEEVDAELAVAAAMRFPRLFVGVVPFVLVLLACAAAAGVAQWAIGARTPQWRPMGVAAGATLLVMLGAGAFLRSIARARVRLAADRLRQVLDEAMESAQAEFEHGKWDRERRLADGLRKRDREVQDAKIRFGPVVAKVVRDHEEFLNAQQAERRRLVEKVEAQREAGLREARQWRETMLSELNAWHERELRAAGERHERQVSEAQRAHDEGRARLEQCWTEGLARIEEPIDARQRGDGQAPLDWNSSAWADWKPPRSFASTVRFGEMQVDLKQITDRVPQMLALPERFVVPALLAFPKQSSLLVSSDHTGRAEAVRTLQMVMMRLLVSLPPGRVRFVIIDPVGLGQNFAGFMHLADYDESLVGSRIWTESDHIERRLADLTEHMETVIQKYLRNEFQTIDEYNAQAGELAEPYRFLVIADFPVGFTEDALRRLASITGTGARCGVYTLISRDARQPLPAGVHLDELAAASVNLSREGGRFVWQDEVFKRFPLAMDPPPSEEFLTRTLHVVGREAREAKRVEVPFESIAPADGKMWSRSTELGLEVPIGRMGATRLQTLRLGRGVAQHGLIAGKTGSGKSTLLHVLVTNLSMWYSPDEVEFYLVDFKKGVEFKAYATHALPHARAVAVESDREFGLSVLQRVDAELGRRGALFRKLGVQDMASYRQASGQKMPRTLLIIDEFQEFFSEDDKIAQDAGLLLDRLVRQGRAFGIHVLLGSQTIGGTSGLARSTIGQIAVRIALQTSEADSQIILGDGNSAARLLSRPGEAIYNDMSGLVEANSPFQVAWLADERRDECLSRVKARARQARTYGDEAVVFEGNVPADITKNASLAALLETPAWPTAVEAPRAWLGEPVAIKEPTAVTLRRQSGANVLIIGQQEEAAMALCEASVVSLAAQHTPGAAKFYVLDGSPTDSPLAKVFPRLAAALPHQIKLVEYRAVPEAMTEIGDELSRRQGGEDLHPPAVYVVVYGLQRYRALRKSEDAFGFSPRGEGEPAATDRQFADLLREGPPLGMHVIAWCDTPAAVERTLDRSSLREFDNRVLFQMSASDSSNLIDSPMANKLGQNRALVYSEEHGTLEKFRPYALAGAEWVGRVRERLRSRSEK